MDNMLIIFTIISLIISIISIYFVIKIKKRYERYVTKLGNGDNIANTLKSYILKVDEVDKKDDEIIKYCEQLNNAISQCIDKVSVVHYNSYPNLKNNLSFSLVLLNQKDDGVVVTSIYGEDSSNIYTKQIKGGVSEQKLSYEENAILEKVINKK